MLSKKIRLFLVKFESQIWFVLCFSFSPFMNVINSAFVPSHTKLLFKVKIKLRKDITFVETFFFFLILRGLLNCFYAFVTRLLFHAFVTSWLRDFTSNVARRPSLVISFTFSSFLRKSCMSCMSYFEIYAEWQFNEPVTGRPGLHSLSIFSRR